MLKNILFCPLDLEINNVKFNSITGMPVVTAYNPYWSSTLLDQESIINSNLNNILEKLPFEKITNVQYKVQQKEVGSHVDVYPSMNFETGEYQHILFSEPAGYRIVLTGNTNSLEVYNGSNWVCGVLPKTPCAYILNSTSAQHRVKFDENRTIIYVRGFLNSTKHFELIEKSYLKYREYAVLNECVVN